MEITVVTLLKVVEKNATANVLRNQSKRRSNKILECVTFLIGSVYSISMQVTPTNSTDKNVLGNCSVCQDPRVFI